MLINTAYEARVSLFIHVSTDEVYGANSTKVNKLCQNIAMPSVRLSTVGSRAFPVATPGARRHSSNTPVIQETLENVLTATIVLTSTLVVLEVTSVT